MSFGSLRPPASPSSTHHTTINRSSSPVGNQPVMQGAAQRYSLGKTPAGAGAAGPTKSPSLQNTSMQSNVAAAAAAARQSAPGFAGMGLRPRSEMVGQHGNQGSAESDAIDQWFEDLQHYEATLEEMAAASLDQNFKEELSAIEQWFRVLSEAERTAALYSLLQESTQVQIRFFITVLQQMARSDPMSALLSPSQHNSTMAEQMEAKLASLGLKSPSAMKVPASPAQRGYRQSSDAAGFLSPNAAALYSPNTGSGDAAAMLAAQRAKLKANRISAPGTLPGEHETASRSFSGGNLDQVQEARSSHSPGPEGSSTRPKSTDGLSAASRSPRASGPLDDQLSPITSSGNWASMVNTPLVNMFDDGKPGHGQANVNLDLTAAQLATVGTDQNGRMIQVDPDVSKFRRRSPQAGGANNAAQGFLSNMYGGTSAGGSGGETSMGLSPNLAAGGASPSPWNSVQSDFVRQAVAQANSPNPSLNNLASAQLSPNALAGLQSPSGGLGNPMNLQMMNAMAAMGGLGNMSAAQFLAMQQQILQNQQQIAAMAAGAGSTGTFRGPSAGFGGLGSGSAGSMRSGAANVGGNFGEKRSAGGLGLAGSATGLSGLAAGQVNSGGRRSPGVRTGNPAARSGAPPTNSASTTEANAGADEIAPLSVLEDVPAWLRYLRLHKYTPNFEGSHWKEMVLMDDQALENKGVAALGARRKMLKTFELVREKYGIKLPGEGESDGNGTERAATSSEGNDDSKAKGEADADKKGLGVEGDR